MTTHVFRLVDPGGPGQPALIETIECESAAEAIAHASRLLGRRRDLDAIDIWSADRILLRLGGRSGGTPSG